MVWENIARWLDADAESSVPSFAQKLRNMEADPPARAWQHVAETLNAEQDLVQRPPVVPFFLRPIPLAACLAGLLIMLGMFFLKNSGVRRSMTGIAKTQKKLSPAEALARRPMPHGKWRGSLLNSHEDTNYLDNYPADQRLSKNTSYTSDDDDELLGYTEPEPTDMEPGGGFVSAPPIRDGHGNIIMDVKLVMTPDNNYIIITAPNGEQTKISRKFITAVCYLNTGTNTRDYFDPYINESTLWKVRFQEWRNQLMKKASFIPASTNFLDILELKEILTDTL